MVQTVNIESRRCRKIHVGGCARACVCTLRPIEQTSEQLAGLTAVVVDRLLAQQEQ